MRGLAIIVALAIWAIPVAAQDGSEAAVRQARQAQAEAERARRELDRMDAASLARAEADRARVDREEARRLAAEGRRQADEADARQRALAAEYARRGSDLRAQAQADAAEADLARRAAERRVWAAEDAARRAEDERRRAAVDRAVRPPPPLTGSSRRVPTEQQRLAERRRQQQAARPIAMKEGVALCWRLRGSQWRCDGPLQSTQGEIDGDREAVAKACGADTIRDLGTVRSYRVFGCGFGINPGSGAPGNLDVPAMFGITVPGRATFRCPPSTTAYCRTR